MRIEKGLFDVYKNPSYSKIHAFRNIVNEYSDLTDNWVMTVRGNSFNFSVTIVNETPLVRLSKYDLHECIYITKNHVIKKLIRVY